ncbi:efflux RND transporter periplasmic adaptor subunit [Amaricoccus sp.]|uniref:efflux RND transporter periplasmic adaptor subunit n=1 Tax=Amaricoccus sp. TaxID=1872485 RepID=UPI001B6F1BCC|nr:efflux RND transporter periplasmic adaptor subunit [Amaricoccus sp.]MBP7241817.1 efflux RND transporter periplasmic adaptor subunit [Amaricoccus sp.]
MSAALLRLACMLAATLTASAAAAQAPAGAAGPKSVGVLTLVSESVPRIFTLPGRAVAYEAAAIRPQVSGIITEILYDAGAPIAAGTPMFRIDPAPYAARVAQATAQVASARAEIPRAQAAFDRAQRLVGTVSTQVDLESAQASLDVAKANLQSAEAALQIAQIDLSWTTVTSPIDGMASVSIASVGDLVAANQTEPLATVTKLDPIGVDMLEASTNMLRVREEVESGRLTLAEELEATLVVGNGRTYSTTGEMVAPGFVVSTTTGTVDVRFRFDNPDSILLPGMFVRGQLKLGHVEAVLVPQTAATRERDGRLTAWVVEDGKAVQREITEDGSYRNQWIVTDGVAGGEQLIVNGLTTLAAGMAVEPVPAEIDEGGVVRMPEAAAPAGAAPAAGASE